MEPPFLGLLDGMASPPLLGALPVFVTAGGDRARSVHVSARTVRAVLIVRPSFLPSSGDETDVSSPYNSLRHRIEDVPSVSIERDA